MNKFIQVTHATQKYKILLHVDKIVSIHRFGSNTTQIITDRTLADVVVKESVEQIKTLIDNLYKEQS
jgi:hypothetical protein